MAAPLLRGGNREIALVFLEAIALLLLVSVLWRTVLANGRLTLLPAEVSGRVALAVLILSPAWLALVHLMPLPRSVWTGLAGRGLYPQLMENAGIALNEWLPLSLVPQATQASLLAGIPLVAGFLAGYLAQRFQLRRLLVVIVVCGFAQVSLGLLQVAGGQYSPLYFDVNLFGRPVGTFANPNHFANYVAMALIAYIWLAWENVLGPSARWPESREYGARHRITLWIAGGLFLVVGILVSRSRGAALTGLPVAILAVGLALWGSGRPPNWRMTVLLITCVLMAAVALIGVDTLLSRFRPGDMSSSASFRSLLSASTLKGALEFWPWGAGWGSFSAVYPRFQTAQIAGYAGYAHDDYAQMLFEGGMFSLLLGACFLWLVGTRALEVSVSAIRARELSPEQMMSAMCGLGLLGFLVHSLIEFNMHIPANAILAALLAGAYLRPLPLISHDRPA